VEPTGYSLCLRVQFHNWVDENIVESDFFSFNLKNFKTGIGELRNFEFKHSFNWRGVIPISISFWNSICASFNYTDLTLILLVNGQILLNSTEKYLPEDNFLTEHLDLYIDLRTRIFSGQITDFNLWSRSLSVTYLYQYSSGCSTNITEILKPDKVIWSRLSITNKNNSKSKIIPKVDLCQDLSFTTTTETVMLRSSSPNFNYKTAYTFCKDFNGNMPYPRNKTELKNIFFIDKDFKQRCENKVWIPITKSQYNSSVLIYDTRTLPEQVISFGTLGKKNLDSFASSNKTCIYLEISSLQYSITGCTDLLCSMCQYKVDKIVFSLHGFNNELEIDDTYAMVREDFRSLSCRLSGIMGKSSIEQFHDKRYVIYKKGCKDFLAYNSETSITPVGIRRWYWNSNNCNNGMIWNTSILLKLSNVSFEIVN